MGAQRRCDPGVRAGRALKARQFASAFETIREFASEPGEVADVWPPWRFTRGSQRRTQSAALGSATTRPRIGTTTLWPS